MDLEYPTDWPERRKFVLTRDGHRCQNCGATGDLHVHHIVPLSRGGSNDYDNLVALCSDCHVRIHPHLQARQESMTPWLVAAGAAVLVVSFLVARPGRSNDPPVPTPMPTARTSPIERLRAFDYEGCVAAASRRIRQEHPLFEDWEVAVFAEIGCDEEAAVLLGQAMSEAMDAYDSRYNDFRP